MAGMREIGVGDVLLGLLVATILIALSAGLAALLFFVVLDADIQDAMNAIAVTLLAVCLVGGLLLARAYPDAGKAMNHLRLWMAVLLIFAVAGSALWVWFDLPVDQVPTFILMGVSQLAVVFFVIQWVLYFHSRDVAVDGNGLDIKGQETSGMNLMLLRRG